MVLYWPYARSCTRGEIMSDVPRNAKYDGLTVLLPDVSRLRPGDILLTLNAEGDDPKGTKMSRAITRTTRGRFSHALICSTPPTFVEAIGPGVSTLSLARCFAHKGENVRVLRYPDTNVATKAARLAQLEVGREYSTAKAVASILPQQVIDKIADHGIFCSALVAQVFSAAGAAEFSETAIEKTTPATIDLLDGLVDITSDIFKPALAPSNIEIMSALDGNRVATPSSRQTEINNRYANALRPAASRIALMYPDAGLVVPTTLFQTIKFIMDAVDAIPIVDVPRRLDFEAELAELDRQAADLMDTGEQAELLRGIIDVDAAQLQRNLTESFKANPDINVQAMRNYLEVSLTQLEARRRALQSFIDWGMERSRTVRSYVALQEQTLKPIQQRVALLREILRRVSHAGLEN